MQDAAASEAKQRILGLARELGFEAAGVCGPSGRAQDSEGLRDFIAAGHAGDMAWLPDTAARRATPRALWPEVRSIVVVAANYGPASDPLAGLAHRSRGVVATYARGKDYHAVLKRRLRRLARTVADEFATEVKLFVDTAPVMEKPLAEQAGLGWQGKHTNLVSQGYGSWLFLGELFTALDLPADAPEADHCGSCSRCLDVCPTKAFPAPYRLDARRCISYLTIEHKGHIAPEFRAAIGNRIYGCDDCLAVCPWNKFARRAHEAAFQARAELYAPRLADLAALDDETFRALFAGSPIKRTGRDRFVRNVLIAIGNSGDASLAEAARARLGDASPLVRAMAVWALARLLPAEQFATLRAADGEREEDEAVRGEWRAGVRIQGD
jgi:epoxyqueuosine reductase